MLYRTPRFSIVSQLRNLSARLGGVFTQFRKAGADAACLDGLTERELGELGLRRYDDRHFDQDFRR